MEYLTLLFATACTLILISASIYFVGVILLPFETQKKVGALWIWTSMQIMLGAVVTGVGALCVGMQGSLPPPVGLLRPYPRWFESAALYSAPFAVSLTLLGIQATVWLSFDLRKLR